MTNSRNDIVNMTGGVFSMRIIFLGAGLGIIGVILGLVKGSVSAAMYDLPILVVVIGIGVAGYGLVKYFSARKNPGEVVDLSRDAMTRAMLNNAIMMALIILIIIICIIQPRFMQVRVFLDILTISSPRLITALGISFSLLIAGVDLSAGRMVGLAAVITSSMLQIPDYANRFYPDMGQILVFIPIVIAILVCMGFGSVSGFLSAKYGMHPFVATLAVQLIVYGTCSLYFDTSPNNSQPIGGVRPDFAALGQAKIGAVEGGFPGISVMIPIAAGICVAIWFLLNKTVFGKNVYAIGGNREAAIVSGVNVFRTIMLVFILGAALYAFSGTLEAARTAGATNNYGLGYELDAIAACVVGGVSLMGGIGRISGIVSGVLVFSVIQYGLQFLNISPMIQYIVKGIILAVAVAIDMTKYRTRN